MKILVITPVGHNTWNEGTKKLCESFSIANAIIDVKSLSQGPESIEDFQSESMAITEIVKIAIDHSNEYDGIVIDCCADPAVDLLKRILKIPVVGPCESSLIIASMISKKIGIITPGNKATSTLLLEERVTHLNFKDKVIYIGAIPLGVVNLDKDIETTKKLIMDEISNAKNKGAEIILLGCTGFSGLAKHLQNKTGMPVIDPLEAAIKIVEDMIEMRIFNYKSEI